MEDLVSAGGVVCRRTDGRIEAVLCGRYSSGPPPRRLPGDDPGTGAPENETFRWSLAKGTPDLGESLEETALREVREEDRLGSRDGLAPGVHRVPWFAGREPDVRFHKTVHFYLMVPVGGDTELHDPEFDVVRCFPSDEALRSLTYPNEVHVLRRALDLISGRQEDGPNG